MSEVEDLRARVQELERKVDLLFRHTGAVDREEVAVHSPEVSAEVEELIARGKTTKAVKLYMKQSGAGMKETMAALEPVARRHKGLR